jgi:hypothetical protein
MKIPKKYLEFIELCKTKQYSKSTHTHHIIPKFMGGTNTNDNYIKLSIDDHLTAHLILAENVDEIHKRKAWDSVAILKKGWGNNGEYIMEQLRINSIGDKNNFYGKHHTVETKLKMKNNNSHLIGKTYNEIYGTEKADEIRAELSRAKQGDKNPMCIVENREKISKTMKLYWTDERKQEHSIRMKEHYNKNGK